MNRHHQIIELLDQQLKQQGNPLYSLIDGKTTEERCHVVFDNYRVSGGSGRGWMLSEVGVQLFKTCFKSHTVSMPPGYDVRTPHLIYLDRISKFPYHIAKDVATLFDPEMAMMLRLSDGKIQTLMEGDHRLGGDKVPMVKVDD